MKKSSFNNKYHPPPTMTLRELRRNFRGQPTRIPKLSGSSPTSLSSVWRGIQLRVRGPSPGGHVCPRALINMRSGLNYEPMSHTTIFSLHVSFYFLHSLYVHNIDSPRSLCAVKLKAEMPLGIDWMFMCSVLSMFFNNFQLARKPTFNSEHHTLGCHFLHTTRESSQRFSAGDSISKSCRQVQEAVKSRHKTIIRLRVVYILFW